MTLSEAKVFREELMDERVHNVTAAEELGEDESLYSEGNSTCASIDQRRGLSAVRNTL